MIDPKLVLIWLALAAFLIVVAAAAIGFIVAGLLELLGLWPDATTELPRAVARRRFARRPHARAGGA